MTGTGGRAPRPEGPALRAEGSEGPARRAEGPEGPALRVAFVTPDEPSVIPPFFERILPALGREVVALAVVSPVYRGWTWRSQAVRFARSFGARELLAQGAAFARDRALEAVRRVSGRGRFRSVPALARAHGVPVLRPLDVNDPAFLEDLRALAPDLVVSVSCPQIFRSDLLSLPRLGCVNVHSALLPEHRGILPTFWAMAEGERETGVTVHFMSPGIDGGEIIARRRVPIRQGETLRSLMLQTKRIGAELVLETIGRMRSGPVATLPNPPGEGSYHSFPTRDDVARFLAAGHRFR
jgi:methionyl-tRNA formyltransferase